MVWGWVGAGRGTLGLGSAIALEAAEQETLRNRLKRNPVFPHPGSGGTPGPGATAPSLAPTSTSVPGFRRRPSPPLDREAREAKATRAPRWPWGGAAPPQLGTQLVSSLMGSLLTHARSNLLGLSWSPPTGVKVLRAPGMPTAEGRRRRRGWRELESVFPGWFRPRTVVPLPPGSGSAHSGLPAGHLGLCRRPPFPGAAVMDIG